MAVAIHQIFHLIAHQEIIANYGAHLFQNAKGGSVGGHHYDIRWHWKDKENIFQDKWCFTGCISINEVE